MKKSAVGMLAALALLAAACGSAPQEEFTTQDATSIRQQSDRFVQAFNGKDIPKIVGMYADNSVVMPPNQPSIRGKDALTGFYQGLIDQGAADLQLEISEVAGHGPIAYQTGSYTLQYKPANGGDATHDRGKYLFVLRKLGTNWRYQYTMWSSDLPKPPGTSTD